VREMQEQVAREAAATHAARQAALLATKERERIQEEAAEAIRA
jgi:hypothetical protein